MRKTLIVTLVLVILGCSQNRVAQNVSTDKAGAFLGSEDEVYYMVTMMSGSEYWVGVYEGFKMAGRQLGVKTVYTGTPEYDINKEVSVFNQVLVKNPAGIAVHPIEPNAFIDPINQAMDSGVKVVTFAADSPDSKRLAFITSDNVKEGYAAADAIAESIGGRGEVCVIENPGQLNHEIRVRSFIEKIERDYNIKVVARAVGNQDANRAYTALQTMVQANPNIKGCFIPEATSGMGAAQAALELGTGINVICVDINEAVLDMISDGKMFGAIQPNVAMQGYLSMLFLYASKHGLLDPMNGWQTLKKEPFQVPLVDNGLDIVTKENAEFFYTKKYLERLGSKGTEE